MFQLEDYKVVFQYTDGVKFQIPGSSESVVEREGVYAHIMVLDKKETEKIEKSGKKGKAWRHMFSGFAAKNPDPNNRGTKNMGRKVALSRALQLSGFDRSTRKRFWNAYFSSRGNKY